MAGMPQMTTGQSQKEVTFNEVTNILGGLQTATPATTITIKFNDGGRAYCLLTYTDTAFTLASAYDGQMCLLVLKQCAAGGKTATFATSNVRYGADITSYTATATANKTDYLGFAFNMDGEGYYDLVSVVKGF